MRRSPRTAKAESRASREDRGRFDDFSCAAAICYIERSDLPAPKPCSISFIADVATFGMPDLIRGTSLMPGAGKKSPNLTFTLVGELRSG